MYIAVVGCTKVKDKEVARVAVLDDALRKVVDLKEIPLSNLANIARNSNKSLNFSVEKGKIVQDMGVFERLSHKGTCFILLKMLVSPSGRTLGYTVLNAKNLSIGNVKREDLLAYQSRQREPLIQNAIIRNDTINAFPDKTFIKEEIGVKPAPAPKKVEPVKVQQKPEPDKAPEVSKRHVPDFISDPNLSPAQRRLLIDGKRNGSLVEYYNKPWVSPEVMEYYNNTIVDKNIAEDCRDIFKTEGLNKDQVNELYQCAVMGVDYSDMLDKNMTPSEMQLRRLNRSMDVWNGTDNPEAPDEELFEKCLRMKEFTLKQMK